MPLWYTIFANTLFFVWLFLTLFLLWRHSLNGSAHVRRLQTLLNENAQKSAEAAMKAADAAHIVAEAFHLLAEQQAKQHQKDTPDASST